MLEVGSIRHVVTAANGQATIPDPTAEGLPLPTAASGSWLTVGIAPFDSVDAASGPGGYALDLFRGAFISSALPAPEQSGSYGMTVERTFTTP